MSSKAQAWVWDNSETNGNDRLVLLYLAHSADDGATGIAGIDEVAIACRVTYGNARDALFRLEDAGVIHRGLIHNGRFTYSLPGIKP